MSNDDAVVAFIRHETHLLNSERYDEWLGLLTDDFEYRMPMPVLRDDPTQPRYSDVSLLAWESVRSLTLRFERILTDFAWATGRRPSTAGTSPPSGSPRPRTRSGSRSRRTRSSSAPACPRGPR